MATVGVLASKLSQHHGAVRNFAKFFRGSVVARCYNTQQEIIFRSQFPDVQLEEMTLYEKVFKMSNPDKKSEFGNTLALKMADKKLTYNQVKQQVFSVAESLQRQFKVVKGDIIGIYLPNCPEYVSLIHGGLASGATVSTVNPEATSWELAQQMKVVKMSLIVTNKNHLPKLLEAREDLGYPMDKIIVVDENGTGPVPFPNFDSLMQCDGSQWNPPDINPKEDVAFVMFSSGTTGAPKGVMLTHYSMVSNVEQVNMPEIFKMTEGRRTLGLLPFYHVYGVCTIINGCMMGGATVSCMAKFDPGMFLKTIQDDKLENLGLVPPLCLFLAKHPMVDKFDLSSVSEIVCGAAPLSADITDQLYKRFPNLELVRQGYGMTETSPVITVDLNNKDKVVQGSAGVLIPNTICKVVDVATGASLPAGSTGEICVQGPQLMKGYFNNEKATKSTIDKEGWLHTGDVGHINADGHLFIEDRLKELIKVKGHQVAPAELEGLLLSHSDVADCCVVQKPDERAGERPKAYVVLKPGSNATVEEILKFANNKLSSYKHLVEIEFINAIPKSASGKILRRYLRDQEKTPAKAASS